MALPAACEPGLEPARPAAVDTDANPIETAESPEFSFGSSGIDAFIRGVSGLAWQAQLGDSDSRSFVNQLADRYAYIRLRDITRPFRFLRQMAGVPPVQLGKEGFRVDLLDDDNPARHYTALLFVGYYLPTWLATLVLYGWEIAGLIRYRGEWSQPDIRSGLLGIHHGKLVRNYGPTVLPALIAAQIAERDAEI